MEANLKSEAAKQISDYNLIACSWHEAGHIICAMLNYCKVYSANVTTIESNKDANTNVYCYDEVVTDPELKRILLMFELRVMYAGLEAERIYYGEITGSSKFPIHLRKGSWYDIKFAQKTIRKNNLATPGKKTQLLKKQLKFEVEQILKTYWEDVRLIAHSLYRKKRLSFDDFKYILSRKSKNKDFWNNRFKKIQIILSDNYCPEDVVKDLVLEDTIFSI